MWVDGRAVYWDSISTLAIQVEKYSHCDPEPSPTNLSPTCYLGGTASLTVAGAGWPALRTAWSTTAYRSWAWSSLAWLLMYSPASRPAASLAGRTRLRFWAEKAARSCTMAKNVSSFLPLMCQASDTVSGRSCSIVQE